MAILKKIFRSLLAIIAILLACYAFLLSLREVWRWLFIGGADIGGFWVNIILAGFLLLVAVQTWDYWPFDDE